MRPLGSIFETGGTVGQAGNQGPGDKGADRAARRLSAQSWSRRQRQIGSFSLILSLVVFVVGLTWVERTGRFGLWALQSGLWLENRLATQGLAAPRVNVSGLSFTTHAEVQQAIDAYDLEPLSRLDPWDMAVSLERLPWVFEARVQRTWPQTVTIWIQEKTPLAILQSGGSAYVVDQAGSIIVAADEELAKAYPNVSGTGAQTAAPELLKTLQLYPEIFRRFVGATYLSERRWNLYLSPGIEVRMPAGDLAAGLANLQTLMNAEDILSADILALDLRSQRPIVVR